MRVALARPRQTALTGLSLNRGRQSIFRAVFRHSLVTVGHRTGGEERLFS
jgi:hypothetical protein